MNRLLKEMGSFQDDRKSALINDFRLFLGLRGITRALTVLGVSTMACGSMAQVFSTWSGNGHEYAVVQLAPGGTWDDANAGATALGGYLATLTSAAENDFAFNLADDAAYWVSQGGAWNFGPWFGLVQEPGSPEPGEGWGWVTGEAFSYENWDPQSNEPNNNPPNENRAHFHAIGSSHQNYWNDLQGTWPDRPNSYVVERDAVPEPGSIVALLGGVFALRKLRRK